MVVEHQLLFALVKMYAVAAEQLEKEWTRSEDRYQNSMGPIVCFSAYDRCSTVDARFEVSVLGICDYRNIK